MFILVFSYRVHNETVIAIDHKGWNPMFHLQAQLFYTERNFQTVTQHFLIYLNIYDTYMAKIYTQYGKIN